MRFQDILRQGQWVRAMLSKCVNPECSEVFRYLRQGKIFLLSPTPEVQMVAGTAHPWLYERFWLCDKCSKQMTVVWGGTEAKLVALPARTEQETGMNKGRLRGHAAAVGRDDG